MSQSDNYEAEITAQFDALATIAQLNRELKAYKKQNAYLTQKLNQIRKLVIK